MFRDNLRGYLVDHPGQADVVLVADETQDLKRRTATLGAQTSTHTGLCTAER